MNLKRCRIIFASIYVLLGLLSIRLFQIQILNGISYDQMSERQCIKNVKLESARAEIYDRNNVVFATSMESKSIFMNPGDFSKHPSQISFLKDKLDLSQSEISDKVHSKQGFVWLSRKMHPADAEAVMKKNIRGVGIVAESDRYYPNGALACHLIGAVGMDNQGLSGIEQSMDSLLRGKEKLTKQIVDGKGRAVSTAYADAEKSLADEKFNGIALTIDRTLQYVAEKEIKQGVEETRAESGMVVIQNPRTGEVLAMASYPQFDPNLFAKGKAPKNLPSDAVQNPVISKLFEPGSTYKMITFAAALEERKIDLNETYDCENGKWKIFDVTINDHEPSKVLSVSEVMEKSSNIGTAKIAQKLGKENLFRYSRAFGFGTKTGITLPGETGGLLRDPKTWSGVSLPIFSFGQGIGVNALQLTNAYSAIANGGILLEPQVVHHYSKFENGKNVVKYSKPQKIRRVVSEQTSRAMLKMLRGVVERGTGGKAKVPGYSVAGKTGTAQKIDPKTRKYYSDKYLSSFCGVLPAENPELVCLVILDEPKTDYWGGTTSAPIFGRIMSRAVQILGIPADQPETSPMAGKKVKNKTQLAYSPTLLDKKERAN